MQKLLELAKNYFMSNNWLNINPIAKKTWQILRKAINNSNKSANSIKNIIVNGLSIDNPAMMADNFNKFFANNSSTSFMLSTFIAL